MNPIFLENITRYAKLCDDGQGDSDAAVKLLATALEHGPQAFHDLIEPYRDGVSGRIEAFLTDAVPYGVECQRAIRLTIERLHAQIQGSEPPKAASRSDEKAADEGPNPPAAVTLPPSIKGKAVSLLRLALAHSAADPTAERAAETLMRLAQDRGFDKVIALLDAVDHARTLAEDMVRNIGESTELDRLLTDHAPQTASPKAVTLYPETADDRPTSGRFNAYLLLSAKEAGEHGHRYGDGELFEAMCWLSERPGLTDGSTLMTLGRIAFELYDRLGDQYKAQHILDRIHGGR